MDLCQFQQNQGYIGRPRLKKERKIKKKKRKKKTKRKSENECLMSRFFLRQNYILHVVVDLRENREHINKLKNVKVITSINYANLRW